MKIKIEILELDEIIMGEILGLAKEEQIEVYRSVVDMVKSRLNKAKSINKKRKILGSYQFEEVKDKIVTVIKDGI
ncbi:MAG: hypothetical protein JSW07_06525 [bacterium]|nr:MAG: hypothetical protein JSW07_06525 [bacterium]